MQKSETSKSKDRLRELRRKGKVFVRVPQTVDMRTTGSGVTFGGHYVEPYNRKSKRKKQTSRQT